VKEGESGRRGDGERGRLGERETEGVGEMIFHYFYKEF
jgi:hypothetical protein